VPVTVDVSDEAAVVDLVARVGKEFGRLDIMVNNAGVATPRLRLKFEEHTLEEFEHLVAINFRGVFLGCREAVRTFKKQGGGGAILNTGSVAGLVGWGGSVYGATKGAVIQMTRGLAIEAAEFDIRVNCICPGGLPSTNFDKLWNLQEDLSDYVAQSHPLGRVIDPGDCAEAALFLVSDAARNITGVVMPVDGGYIAR
jgi:NAD(P)-dependent dehydrogenase (short-subunit alcohol dehydrogenase family)